MTLPKWHDGNQQWAQKIGYELSKDGVRVRKWFYFSGPKDVSPPAEVIADSINKQRDWAAIKAKWGTIRPLLERYDPEGDYALPVWYDREALQAVMNPSPDEAAELKKAQKVDANFQAKEAVDLLSVRSKCSCTSGFI